MVDETQHAPSSTRQISRHAWKSCGKAREILWETFDADHIAASGTAMLPVHGLRAIRTAPT
jgi:hypothetical protein